MANPFKFLHEPIKVLNDPKLVALKSKRRDELREEFYRRALSPYVYIKGDGSKFDPAVQRYISTLNHMDHYFRATPKIVFNFILVVIVPMVGIGVLFKRDKDRQELELRTGQVAYRDRPWKFA